MMRYSFFVPLLIFAFSFGSCKNDAPAEVVAPAGTEKLDPEILRYTQKIKDNPAQDSLYYLRAQAYYKSEGFDEAIADLQKAISLDSTKADYYHLLADTYLDYFKSYPALQTMIDARNRFPTRIPTLLKLSEFYLILKKYGEAAKVVEDILKLDPQNAEAYFMAAMIGKDKNEIPFAIKNMERSVAIDPDNLDAWIILGNLVSEKNDQVALKYYQNALRLDSTSMEAWDGIATYYHKRGEWQNAKETYAKMVIMEPSRPGTYYDLGLLFLEKDSLDQAKMHFQVAIDNDPLFFKAIYFRGLAYERSGDLEQARKDFDQASRMVTDYQDAKDALKRVEEALIKQKK